MNVFHKTALEGLKRNKTRTLVTIIGVALSSALITAIAVFGISLLGYLINGAALRYGNWHIEYTQVSREYADNLANQPNVTQSFTVSNIATADIKGSDNIHLDLIGMDNNTFEKLPITLLSGRLPKTDSEIIIPEKMSANYTTDINIGSKIAFNTGGKNKLYTVVGTCQKLSFTDDSDTKFTAVTSSKPMSSNLRLFLTLDKPKNIHRMIKQGTATGNIILNEKILRFMGLSENKVFNSFMFSVGSSSLLIIMIGSIFLIYNAFNISLSERTRQLGMLMSVGATPRQIKRSVLFEGLCIGAVGIPVGMIIGIFGISGVLEIAAKQISSITYSGIQMKAVIYIPALIAAAAVSLMTVLLSAYIPAKRAANIPVMECLRQSNDVDISNKAVKFFGFTQYKNGIEIPLAMKNFARNRKRYKSVVLSLTLSMILFVSANAFVVDMKTAAGYSAEQSTYDIAVTVNDANDNELLGIFNKLNKIQGIEYSSYQAMAQCTAEINIRDYTRQYIEYSKEIGQKIQKNIPMMLQMIDDKSYMKLIREIGLPEDKYAPENGKIIASAKYSVKDGDYYDLFSSKRIPALITPEKSDSVQSKLTLVNHILPDVLPILTAGAKSDIYLQAVIPYSSKNTFISSDSELTAKGMTFVCSENTKKAVNDIKNTLSASDTDIQYKIYNLDEMTAETKNIIFIINVFAYSFIAIITLIGVANVFNTISTNIRLRRRELAMLRSIGMSDGSFNKMMCFECVMYGIRTLVIGLPLSILLSLALWYFPFSHQITLRLPWVSILQSIIGVFIIISITMMYSVKKLKKENICDILTDDTI